MRRSIAKLCLGPCPRDSGDRWTQCVHGTVSQTDTSYHRVRFSDQINFELRFKMSFIAATAVQNGRRGV